MRSQLRLAIGVLGTIVLCLGSLPLLFFVLPQLRDLHVLGIPLNWLVLGFLVYPFLLLLGWFFVRQTERTEREFADLVDHP